MAKKKINKQERHDQRIRKARQWLTTYTGSPKKMTKHYRERFHLDISTAGGAPYGTTWEELGLEPYATLDDVCIGKR